MKIVIVGSSGFIGNYLLSKLSSTFNTLAIGRIEKKDCKNYKSFSMLSSKDLADATYIVFCYSLRKIIYDVNDHVESNEILKTILKKVDSTSSQLRGIIYLSSFAVYRGYQGGVVSEYTPVRYSGDDLYAHTKFTEEEIILDFSNQKNIDSLIIRLPSVVGVGVHGNLFYKIISALKNNLRLELQNEHIPFNTMTDLESIYNIVCDFISGTLSFSNRLLLMGASDIKSLGEIVGKLKAKIKSTSSISWGHSKLRGPSVVNINISSINKFRFKSIDEILLNSDKWISG